VIVWTWEEREYATKAANLLRILKNQIVPMSFVEQQFHKRNPDEISTWYKKRGKSTPQRT
jgi:hypothetical protein